MIRRSPLTIDEYVSSCIFLCHVLVFKLSGLWGSEAVALGNGALALDNRVGKGPNTRNRNMDRITRQ